MAREYKEKEKAIYREKTLILLDELPDFCRKYYTERELRLAEKSQFNYAFKMKKFLEYLVNNHPHFARKVIKDIKIEDIAVLKQDDFLDFASWILRQPSFKNSSKMQNNSKSTADNYLASISSYMSFFVKKKWIPENPLLGVERKKKEEKNIIYLEEDERTDFMESVATGDGLTNKQRSAWNQTYLRDTCILRLFLDTGIRVSELVGLDTDDVDLKNCKLNIIRKGNKEDNVYFSDTTADLLAEYLSLRKDMFNPVDNERALFLVSIGKYRGERISVRAIERLVKKIAKAANIPGWAAITPHKLRSSYAMAMLKALGNLAIVKEQLGHEHITTTSIYARAMDKDKIDSRNAIF